tara:strand:- start:67 stop:477 length:411 start_codon:yes stop_codon:yes gene_type:complete
MKNLLTTIALIIVSISYAQRVFILPKSNDTLQFKIQNDTPHKFKIIKDGRTIFQNKFKGIKTFDICTNGYLYNKEIDSVNSIVKLFFDRKNRFSKAELRKILKNEAYILQQDLINEMLMDYQERDIEEYESGRDDY